MIKNSFYSLLLFLFISGLSYSEVKIVIRFQNPKYQNSEIALVANAVFSYSLSKPEESKAINNLKYIDFALTEIESDSLALLYRIEFYKKILNFSQELWNARPYQFKNTFLLTKKSEVVEFFKKLSLYRSAYSQMEFFLAENVQADFKRILDKIEDIPFKKLLESKNRAFMQVYSKLKLLYPIYHLFKFSSPQDIRFTLRPLVIGLLDNFAIVGSKLLALSRNQRNIKPAQLKFKNITIEKMETESDDEIFNRVLKTITPKAKKEKDKIIQEEEWRPLDDLAPISPTPVEGLKPPAKLPTPTNDWKQ